MGKGTIVAILFDCNTENVYFSGQAVTGRVHVETSEVIKMRGIRLEMCGSAHVSWSTGSGKSRRTYTGKEALFDLSIDLMGSRNHDSELYLQSGTYDMPFNFFLPSNLPSSYEGCHGHIRYKAKAVIDIPLRIDDTAEVTLTVVHLLDLNHELPQLREPVVVQSQDPASSCCCVSGTPEINIQLNKGLFVVGETILVQGEITNRTNSEIKCSKIVFAQITEFCATGFDGQIYRRKNESKVLEKLKRPAIPPGRTDSWDDIAWVIPSVEPSRLDGCNIINISYVVEVAVVFDQCCNISGAQAELIIGGVPLASDFQSSVITSQPSVSTSGIAVEYQYPNTTNISNLDFKLVAENSCNNGFETFPDVHKN